MARVVGHLSVAALEERYESSTDVTSSRHFQTIWLLAKGHSTGDVAAMTSFGQRWIEQLLERYNEQGPRGFGRFAPGQRRCSDDLEAAIAGETTCSVARSAGRRRPVDEPQGGKLDGERTGLGQSGDAAGLGSAESMWLVASEAAPEKSQIGDA